MAPIVEVVGACVRLTFNGRRVLLNPSASAGEAYEVAFYLQRNRKVALSIVEACS